MKSSKFYLLAGILAVFSSMTVAQAPVVPSPRQEALLVSADSKLAQNKKLVFDFWREVVDAGQVQLIEKYVADNYIQHNPNIASGRTALVEQIAKNVKQQPVKPQIKAPVVSIVAEGNLVVVSLASEMVDPKDPEKRYTTTWFDMFRIENGKIAEHWDSALKLP